MKLSFLIIGLLVVGLIALGFYYNRLLHYKKWVEVLWNDLDIDLKRRYEIIPKLLGLMQKHAGRETAIFEKITLAQRQANSAGNVADQAVAEEKLSQSLKSFFAISENYPMIKSEENFRHLQQALSEVEDDIQQARRKFNRVVEENNRRTGKFPGRIIAGPLGFGKFDLFIPQHKV